MNTASWLRPPLLLLLTGSFCLADALPLEAQYFGRNKVQWERFDFRVLETPSYRVHFYPEEEEAVRDLARMAERWTSRLSTVFRHQLTDRKPLIIYANHPDFQQTNVIADQLTEGTGGVTEALRDRMIMPLTGVYADNDHVLGHELVHEYQYDIAGSRGGGGLRGMSSLPLWFIEGMAEYLSLGRSDPHTAMWMRDAVIQNRIPTVKQLGRDPSFFPYRYGEALWAYVAGRWGDRVVADLYREGLKGGLEPALRKVLGVSSDSLSSDWAAATRAAYEPIVAPLTKPADLGQAVLAVRRTGESNLSPVLSPDGRYVAFFAQRGLFGVDLYVADAMTGQSVRKLASTSTNTEYDALSFISSAGTWSPDGRRFAFVVYARGNNELAILDIATRQIVQRIVVPGVGAIQNPAWSPDGTSIAFSGSDGGVTDLYVYDLAQRTARRLTNDRFADIHPTWSPDGRFIAFATDRGPETSFERLTYSNLRLALIDASGANLRLLSGFQDAKHINPQFSVDGASLYFISNRGGISDIYRLNIATGQTTQVTRIATGVSGITRLSPALSVARQTGQLMFSVFERQGFAVHSLPAEQATGTALAPTAPVSAGILPPATVAQSTVSQYLADPVTGLPATTANYDVKPYNPSIRLAYVGQPTVGVTTGGFGTFVSGGTALYFTDILGNRNLGATIQASGTLLDIGGQLSYQNVERRLGWGLDVAHIPYLTGFASARIVNVDVGGQPVRARLTETVLQRVFIDQAGGTVWYPFSTTRRAEFGASYTRLWYKTEIERIIETETGLVAEQRFDTASPPGANFAQATAALVGDNSFFGFTAPIAGWRYRLQVAPTFGSLRFQTALADARRYFFAQPVTFAFRGLHYGRYGSDAEDPRMAPLFVGYPTLVRGYSPETFEPSECTRTAASACPEIDRLAGSRMAVFNAELRFPLLGTREYGLIRSPFVPIDIAAFLDAGVAWTSSESPTLEFSTNSTERTPAVSTGISARANVLGYAVLEVFYARPFQRPDRGWILGFQLQPGW